MKSLPRFLLENIGLLSCYVIMWPFESRNTRDHSISQASTVCASVNLFSGCGSLNLRRWEVVSDWRWVGRRCWLASFRLRTNHLVRHSRRNLSLQTKRKDTMAPLDHFTFYKDFLRSILKMTSESTNDFLQVILALINDKSPLISSTRFPSRLQRQRKY